MTSELWKLTATDIAAGVRARAFTAVEATQSALDRLEAVNPLINAIVDHRPEQSLMRAAKIDAMIAAGRDPGPLAGVPVTIKVTNDEAGFATTYGVVAHKDNIAAANGTVVDNLERAGAVSIGRSNMPSFGVRWFTTSQLYPDNYNPFDRGLTPGGSSGGAASAVASGIGAIAHGTDIGGSIRYPAYACGVHGLRPTLGRVPNYNASMPERGISGQLMSVSGPLARTIDDLRLGFEAMVQPDPRDPWFAPVPLKGPDVPRKVALSLRPDGLDTQDAVVDALLDAAERLRDAGWQVDEVDTIPPLKEAGDAQVKLWLSEDFDGALAAAEADGDPGVIAMLRGQQELARSVGLPELHGLLRTRATLARKWQMFFEDYPILLLPNSAETPFPFAEDLKDPEAYLRVWAAQLPQLGIPFLALPGLSVATGMKGSSPLGVQLTAARYREDLLLAAGADIAARGGPDVPVDPR
ncbi:amidase family protein [Chachezhania sediminis]|uniref:amidase family protein n=1 Tax=Chachezhania sediminis TaxID=2599291 RepID=UPI00131B1BA7|nr:amidase family protein [Chachezhania sediminis]